MGLLGHMEVLFLCELLKLLVSDMISDSGFDTSEKKKGKDGVGRAYWK